MVKKFINQIFLSPSPRPSPSAERGRYNTDFLVKFYSKL